MQYRRFDKLGVDVSAFGLGCMRFPMYEVKDAEGKSRRVVDEELATAIIRRAIDGGVNYVDTAYVYSHGTNESVAGRALRDGYRERVFLATKLPTWNCKTKEDLPRLFEEQCKNLETDWIDFYLVHALDGESWKKIRDLGVREFLDDLKAKGRIRFACFSFHDSFEAFEEILNDYDWDMCQLQYNYMDVENQAGTRGVTLAGEKGVPVVIMEGLLGGKLAKVPAEVGSIFEEAVPARSAAEWGFRWLCNHKEILTVLSGVTDLAQVEDNLRIFSEATVGGMSDKELAAVERARAAYQKRIRVGCTGCEYCLPCPKGVAIPEVFATWNEVYQFEEENLQGNRSYARLVEKGKGADLCVSCRKCQNLCPQHLNIPDLLAQAHDSMK